MHKEQTYKKITFYEGRRGEVKKVVLLHSGNFDTSILTKWIRQEYKADVTVLIVDIGQTYDFRKIKQQALKYGAKKVLVIDAKDEFADEYVAKAIQANASYQTSNHLATPLSWLLFAKWAIKTAALIGADAIAHDASGRNNDQVIFESTALTLNPDIKIIAPFREQSDLLPAQRTTVPFVFSTNLWKTSLKGGDIDNPGSKLDLKQTITNAKIIKKQTHTTEEIYIAFEKGVPVSFNNKKMKLSELIIRLNQIGKTYNLGITPHIEDQLIGLKRRIISVAPAAEILILAHKELEAYVSTKAENEFKPIIDMKWASLCSEGLWYEPLMDNITAYIQKANHKVTGKVHIKLAQESKYVIAIQTSRNIFEEKLPTFIAPEDINYNAAAGFIEIHSLPMKLARQADKTAFISIGKRANKIKLLPQIKQLSQLGYKFYATYKTHKFLRTHNIEAIPVHKISEGQRKPNLSDLLNTSRFDFIINIPIEKEIIRADEKIISQKALQHQVPLFNTVSQAQELVKKLHMLQAAEPQNQKEIAN